MAERETNMKSILSLTFGLILLLILSMESSMAQETGSSNKLKPPNGESFEGRDDVLAPARDAACPGTGSIMVKNCPVWHNTIYIQAHRLTLYNGDGEEWSRFSLKGDEPDYFEKMKELAPLGKSPQRWPNLIVLRLVGESEHWYKVEINEKTRETKYALKSDPLWAKTSWYTWLNASFNLYPDYSKNKLRDKPGGEVIKEYADMKFITYRFLEQDGEWVKVDCMDGEYNHYKGWIRWREGRNIIVEWYGNSDRYPSDRIKKNN
jgi:hypothetical protein